MDVQGGNDTIIGDGNDNELWGGQGNDTITGGGGSDYIKGDIGTDTRGDTNTADCAGDTLSSIENDNCVAVTPAPVTGGGAPVGTDICITQRTRVAIGERNTLLIFSDFSTTPNGMMITQIPLGSLPAPTDAQKAENAWVGLISKDSEFAPGWSIYLYWHESHYGVTVYKDGGKTVFDDTGAICGWF